MYTHTFTFYDLVLGVNIVRENKSGTASSGFRPGKEATVSGSSVVGAGVLVEVA
jgi:hypothetical protein